MYKLGKYEHRGIKSIIRLPNKLGIGELFCYIPQIKVIRKAQHNILDVLGGYYMPNYLRTQLRFTYMELEKTKRVLKKKYNNIKKG